MSDGITVTRLGDITVEVFPISLCLIDGWKPHRQGEHSSLTCLVCEKRGEDGEAARFGPREAS